MTRTAYIPQYNPKNTTYLIVSVVLHIIILSSIKYAKSNYNLNYYEKEVKLIIENPENTPEIKAKQIVSPSDIQESKEEPNSPLLSDKNTVVKEEQIKRGDIPEFANQPITKQNSKPLEKSKSKSAEQIKVTKAPPQKIDSKQLLDSIEESTLDSFTTKTFAKNSPQVNEQNNKSKSESSTESAEARINALGGIAGNPDLLNNIRDGEITLLNAKADRFAVFVRRVALQVFSALRNSNWYEVGGMQSGFETGEVTIRAVLDKTGKFISLELLSSSQIDLFDKVIVKSVRKGAWDRNPPPSALAADGTIKFIFQSKAWVKGGPNGRTSQWIQLATGLE